MKQPDEADAVLIAEELLRMPYRNVQLAGRILALVAQSGLSQHEIHSALSAADSLMGALYPCSLPLTATSDQRGEEHRQWMAQRGLTGPFPTES